MNYGDKITSLRKSKNMTQAELGNALNISYQAVSKWERNISQPDFETMTKIAKIFKVDLNYFTETEDKIETININEQVLFKPNICEHCGKVISDYSIYSKDPYIICNDCHAKEEKERKEIELLKQDDLSDIKNNYNYSLGNNLIISGIVGVGLLVLILLSIDTSASTSASENIFTSIFFAYTAFAFIFQMKVQNIIFVL